MTKPRAGTATGAGTGAGGCFCAYWMCSAEVLSRSCNRASSARPTGDADGHGHGDGHAGRSPRRTWTTTNVRSEIRFLSLLQHGLLRIIVRDPAGGADRRDLRRADRADRADRGSAMLTTLIRSV
jgi:hypothetical protein